MVNSIYSGLKMSGCNESVVQDFKSFNQSSSFNLPQYLNVRVLQDINPSVLYWSIILVTLQILDGCLTAHGVSLGGVHFEGNPIIRIFINHFGVIYGVALAKGISILIICALVLMSSKVRWLVGALKLTCAIYLFIAVVPWLVVLNLGVL